MTEDGWHPAIYRNTEYHSGGGGNPAIAVVNIYLKN